MNASVTKSRISLEEILNAVTHGIGAALSVAALVGMLIYYANGGVWHLTAGGETTWHGFAEAIFEAAHARGLIARVPRVVPIATADYPTPAKRPGYSVLDTSGLRSDFGIDLPDWSQGVASTLEDLKSTFTA